MSALVVHSSHGDLRVDPATGIVTEINAVAGGDDLSFIWKFDLEEWKSFWGEELPGDIDILDLGYLYREGVKEGYEPPEEDWRDVIKEGLADGFFETRPGGISHV